MLDAVDWNHRQDDVDRGRKLKSDEFKLAENAANRPEEAPQQQHEDKPVDEPCKKTQSDGLKRSQQLWFLICGLAFCLLLPWQISGLSSLANRFRVLHCVVGTCGYSSTSGPDGPILHSNVTCTFSVCVSCCHSVLTCDSGTFFVSATYSWFYQASGMDQRPIKSHV